MGFENVPVIGGERSLPSLSKIVQAYSKIESAAKTEETTDFQAKDGII